MTRAGKVLQQLTEQEPCYSRGKFRFRVYVEGLGLRVYAPLTEQESCYSSWRKVAQQRLTLTCLYARSPPRGVRIDGAGRSGVVCYAGDVAFAGLGFMLRLRHHGA